jgi:hypothetical protein
MLMSSDGRLKIPVPALDVQRGWGEVFRRLEETRRLVHESAAQGEAVLQDLGDAFATWVAQGTLPALSRDKR